MTRQCDERLTIILNIIYIVATFPVCTARPATLWLRSLQIRGEDSIAEATQYNESI